jgi:hypothetical protein
MQQQHPMSAIVAKHQTGLVNSFGRTHLTRPSNNTPIGGKEPHGLMEMRSPSL